MSKGDSRGWMMAAVIGSVVLAGAAVFAIVVMGGAFQDVAVEEIAPGGPSVSHGLELDPSYRHPSQPVAGPEWKTFKSPADGYSVLFPGQPQTGMHDSSGVLFSWAQSHGEDATYYVVATYPATATTSAPDFNIEHVMDETIKSDLKGNNAEIVSDKKIELDGHPGREILFSGRTPDGSAISGIARYYAVNTVVYAVMITGSQRDNVRIFFDSFKLTGETPATNQAPAASNQ